MNVRLLKILYAVNNCFLFTTTLTKLFLGNVLTVFYLKTLHIFSISLLTLNSYIFHACVCLALAGSLAFLLAVCFSTNFLRVRPQKSKGLPEVCKKYAFLCNKFIYLAMPIAHTIFLICALFNVLLCHSMYWPAIGLYHQVPQEFVRAKSSHPTLVSSVLKSIKDHVKGGAPANGLDWSLVELSTVQYHYFELNFFKFILGAILNVVLFIIIFVKVNFCKKKKPRT